LIAVRCFVAQGTTFGTPFEVAIRDHMRSQLPSLDPHRSWIIENSLSVANFDQYRHLDVLDKAVKRDVTLRTEFGRDYRVVPDVVIGVQRASLLPLLHAVISCKWSMRSDRVQNVRPEGSTLMRHRRGRAPHFVVVTCEPLPSRISAIAMTTGEVDRVYHVAFEETAEAVAKFGTKHQRDTWLELVAQGRLWDFNALPETIALT
jgi:NgoMIV restriction enzyme